MKKPYRIIYNNDGGTLFRPFAPNTDVPFSVEGFLDKTVGQLVDTQVDVLTWTLGTDPGRRPGNQGVGRATNQYCHETDVGERFYERDPPYETASWSVLAGNVRQMIEQGHDPPRVVIERGHNHGLEVFLGFRMNDCHDARVVECDCAALFGTDEPTRFPAFKNGRFIEENIRGHVCRLKLDHPELLIGEHSELTRVCHIAFDYAHERVRDFRLALIREACEKYDLDGIELDFLRHPLYFKPGQEAANLGLMTEFMGQVRDVLDRVGQSRGKRLALAIRTLPTFEASKAIGLDVRMWLTEGWIDVLIGGICDRIHLPMGDLVRTAHEHDCSVYASVKTDAYRRYGCRPDIFPAIAANHYRAGVDGIYLFNMDGLRDVESTQPGLGSDYDYRPLREIGSFEQIRFQNKHYILDNKGRGHKTDVQLFCEWPEALQDRLLRSETGTATSKQDLPVRLLEDQPASVRFYIADSAHEAEAHGTSFDATLVISVDELTMGEHLLEIGLNGEALAQEALSKKLSYEMKLTVDPASLRLGQNVLTFTLRRQDPNVRSELWLKDVRVLVEYGSGLRQSRLADGSANIEHPTSKFKTHVRGFPPVRGSLDRTRIPNSDLGTSFPRLRDH